MALLQQLFEERDDDKRDYAAPDERVEDHHQPPEDAAAGCTEKSGEVITGFAEESPEDDEENEVQHAQRHIREQKRFNGFHFYPLFSI